MSTTTLTMPSTPMTNGRTDKSSKKQSKIVILSLPPLRLKLFANPKDTLSVASSPAPTVEDLSQLKPVVSHENHSDTNSTPAPMQDAPTPGDATKMKITLTNGVKRSTPLPADSSSKPRGKPGPKKKPRLEDGTIDHSNKPVTTGTANPKLGPKANTGFINANLRALDRSGNPCRRWQKKGFSLKSFTGHSWELSSWKGSDNSTLTNGATDSSNPDNSMLDSSDQKPSESDTAAGSNVGDTVDKMDMSTPAPSSPLPVLATLAVPIQT